MSRAVKEDLSQLTRGERLSKRFSNFKEWAYDGEKKTYFGERNAIQWGQLCGYYILFYLTLSAFTAIFFGVLGFMLPTRPYEVVPGICSTAASAGDGCGPGPFFQVLDLFETADKGEARFTDEILQFSLCEPGFVAIPRALNLGGAEPKTGYNNDDSRKGYSTFTTEVDRVYCEGVYNDSTYNPSCNNNDKAIMPLIPLQPDGSGTVKYADEAQISKIAENFTAAAADGYTKPTAIYDFKNGGDSYSTFMVFFRFNKVWNFQPYTEFETELNEPIDIQNKIGVKCSISSSGCTDDTLTAIDFNNQIKTCDSKKPEITADGRVSIDMLSNVMQNYDGFPWRGGPLNMGFGSMAITLKDPSTPPPEFEISCTMGDFIPKSEGKTGLVNGIPVEEKANVIQNFNKQAGARAYTNSDGYELVIPVS